MSADRIDVVVSGAGPNGLMVACELALAGVRPVVLECLPEPSAEPKANGLVGQVVRALDMRGLYHEFGGAAGPPQRMARWVFSGMQVPLADMADNPMYALMIQQPRLVRLLDERARRLGVDVRWGHGLTDMVVGTDGVALTVASPDGTYGVDATYLVGADGGRSHVRKSTGIDFPGVTSPMVNRIAHVHLPVDMRASDGGLEVQGFGHLPPMHSRLESGGIAFAELEPGRPIIATMELGGPSDPATPMTLQEMRDSLRRVLGVDLPIEPPRGPGPHALRRTDGQNTRQADRYRAGNVFLVGDSAHVHSAMGGPGLNLGLQDAMNLGWKLAAEVNGWAPAGLLDTYQSERYPVGERVMMHSLSQTALMMPGPEIAALRQLFGELLQTTDGASHVAHMLAGSDVRYDVADSHPLAGRFVPDVTLAGGRRVTELLRDARPVLLDLSGGVIADTASGWRHRVDAVAAMIPGYPVGAILIRPDGYVAWAADTFDRDAEDRLHAALRRWCGAEDAETAELTA